MSIPPSRFTELPAEVSERILLHVPGQDVIKMEAVSRYFLDLVRSSPTLQYRRELFSAGLIDNSLYPRDLAEHRKLCKEYINKWTGTAKLVRRTHKIPVEPQINHAIALGEDLIALHQSFKYDYLNFLRVQPAVSQRPVEGWSIPRFPFKVLNFAVYPPDNLLAVVERRGQTIQIHLLNLLDGSPYGATPSNQIACEIPSGSNFVHRLAITGSRIMVYTSCQEESEPTTRPEWRMVVWDTKTGDPVLDVSTSDGDTLIGPRSYAIFLDEFQVLVTNYDEDRAAPELVVFNTLISQGHPKSLRRFGLPPRYWDRSPRVHPDHSRPLGTVFRDSRLISDPTQAILAMELTPTRISAGPWVLLAVRTDTLIEHTYSTRTEPRIPWEVWGGGAVVMEIPLNEIPPDSDDLSIFVHSAYMAIVIRVGSDVPDYHLYTFDFSKRGCHALPLWSGEGNGTERRPTLEGGRKLALEGNQDMYPEDMLFLGNSTMVYLDQTEPGTPDGDTALHVWEITGA